MAQRGRAAPQPVGGNTPGKPAPTSAGRTSGWRATFLILCAICIAGIIPVYLAGQLLGLWHVPIPNSLPFPLPFPTPTSTLGSGLTALGEALWAV
jgi:hypothetical protein